MTLVVFDRAFSGQFRFKTFLNFKRIIKVLLNFYYGGIHFFSFCGLGVRWFMGSGREGAGPHGLGPLVKFP